jgi:deazaflavin-dependent oxidoreductase (nitroreductase family)
MTTRDPGLEARLKWFFKNLLNKFMLAHWRLGIGAWLNLHPSLFGQFMMLVHKGRKTGRTRYTPLNYAIVGGELYCTAGFGKTSAWYRNIQANPNVEVWLDNGWWAGVAEDVSDSDARLPLLRQVLIGSGFVAPLVGIHPRTMSDEELYTATSSYRLIHIRRTAARTGSGGPGDLAWVWPLATLALLGWLLRRRKP